MKTQLKLTLTLMSVGVLLLTGCLTPCRTCGDRGGHEEAPAPRVRTTDDGCPEISMQGNMATYTMYVPTGEASSSTVRATKTGPARINVGQEVEYVTTVTNLTDCAIEDVTLTDSMLTAMNVVSTDPTPASTAGNKYVWKLGKIEAHESAVVKVKANVSAPGTYEDCLNVTYTPYMCMEVVAVQPELGITAKSPEEVVICDQIPVTLTYTNPGSGTATNVKVMATMPAGFTTVDGQSSATFDIGDFPAGETRTVQLMAKAAKPGSYTTTAKIQGDGLSDQAETTTVVRQPMLTISKTGTDTQYVGRDLRYEIEVENTGDATAKNLVVTDTIPAGTTFVSASNGGMVQGGSIVWNLGDLGAGQKMSVSATLKGSMIASVSNTATATAECAKAVSDTVTAQVKGIPAVLLEVIDVMDPVEVGSTETYVITATNQGSLDDTNIVITCTLEDSQEYVSSEGATTGSVQGQVVTFKPLATLGPKQKATWKVVVKATKPGDVRFAVEMNTDQIQRPVNETESTNQY